jgi:hypothetical protein
MRTNPPPGMSYIDRIRNDLEREHELRKELVSTLQGFGMDINNGKHIRDESLVYVCAETLVNECHDG